MRSYLGVRHSTNFSYRAFLFIIFLFAVGIRLFPLTRPGTAWPMWYDSGGYVQMADGLRSGCGFAREIGGHCLAPEIVRTPGYPLFLSMLPDLRTAIAIQAVLATLTCVLIAAFIRPRWGSRAALLAALLVAIDVPSAHASSQILSDSLFQTLVASTVISALLAIDRQANDTPATSLILLSAILCATALMIRPNGLSLIPLMPLPFLCHPRLKWRHKLLSVSIVVSIPLLAATLWIARNKQLTGVPTFSLIGSYNAYYYEAGGIEAYLRDSSLDAEQIRLAREIRAPTPPSPWKSNDVYRKLDSAAMTVILAHPVTFALLTAEDFVLLLTMPQRRPFKPLKITSDVGPSRIRNAISRFVVSPLSTLHDVIDSEFDSSPMLVALALLQVAFTCFTLGGVVMALMQMANLNSGPRIFVWFPLLVAFVLLLSAAGPEADARLRLPAIPLLVMVSAIGWVRRVSNARESFAAQRPIEVDGFAKVAFLGGPN